MKKDAILLGNVRKSAIDCLMRINSNYSYSNLAVAEVLKKENLGVKDKALLTKIVYGTLERRITIDYIIEKLSERPVGKIKPFVREVIRTAIYQIYFMDKIPPFAIVNEAVNIVKSEKKYAFSSGFVNAVLRNAIRQKNTILPTIGDSSENISIIYSAPLWLVNELLQQYGRDGTIQFLEDSLRPSDTVIRVNTLKCTVNELTESLINKSISVSKTSIYEALFISDFGSIEALDEYKKGLFHVQDIASQIAINALNIQTGQRVLDICAAPGGKSFTAAEIMNDSGQIISCDNYPHRVELIWSGIRRLNLKSVTALENDALKYNPEFGQFDRIICDVPCSGIGVIRKKPDIKFKNPKEFDELTVIQYNILSETVKYLKDDGLLLYSTCTVRKQENEEVVQKFVKHNPEYKIVNMRTLLPQTDGTDGFFICIISR